MNKFVLAGLLTYALFKAFPSLSDSGMKYEQSTAFTATGIVPESHRASLLIPIARKPERNEGREFKCKMMNVKVEFRRLNGLFLMNGKTSPPPTGRQATPLPSEMGAMSSIYYLCETSSFSSSPR